MSTGIVPPIRIVGGAIRSDGEQHVAAEVDALAEVRDVDGERLGQAEEEREQQRIHADARLDEGVEAQQPGSLAARAGPLDEAPRDAPEQRVARRQPSEKDRQHRGDGLALRPEQDRQVFLPGHLVDEPAEAREHGEEQRDRSDHG